jgi:hypothetical protein
MSDAASTDLVAVVISVTVVFAVLGAIAMTYILYSYVTARRRRARAAAAAAFVNEDEDGALDVSSNRDAISNVNEAHRRPIASPSSSPPSPLPPTSSALSPGVTRVDSHRVPLSPVACIVADSQRIVVAKKLNFVLVSPRRSSRAVASRSTMVLAVPTSLWLVLPLSWCLLLWTWAGAGVAAANALASAALLPASSAPVSCRIPQCDRLRMRPTCAPARMAATCSGRFVPTIVPTAVANATTAGSPASVSPARLAPASRSTQQSSLLAGVAAAVARAARPPTTPITDTSDAASLSSGIGELAAPDAMRSFRLRSSGLVRSQTDDDF